MTTGRAQPPAPNHRAPTGPDALHACVRAHAADAHQGNPRYSCPTCMRYLHALGTARRDAP